MNNNPYIDKKGRVYRYGEFFPMEISPFAYNETIAQEHFSLTKEQAEAVMGAAESSGTLKTATATPDGTDNKKEYLNPETSEEELNGDNS
jgi:hypothetical protein